MPRSTISCRVKPVSSENHDYAIEILVEHKNIRIPQKIRTLKKYISKHPKGWKKRLELAELLYESGEIQEAILAYKHVLGLNPSSIDIRVKLGKLLYFSNQVMEANRVLDSASKDCRNEATYQHIKGLIYLMSNKNEQAELCFQKATSESPQNPAHWLALGRVRIKLRHYTNALESFRTLLKIRPQDLTALSHIYDLYRALKKYSEADAVFCELKAIAPHDYLVLRREVSQRFQENLVHGAEGRKTKTIIAALRKLTPHSIDVTQLQSRYHSLRGESELCVQVWQEFTKTYPNKSRGWYHLAQLLLHLKDYPYAASTINRAYQLSPQNSDIREMAQQIAQSRSDGDGRPSPLS